MIENRTATCTLRTLACWTCLAGLALAQQDTPQPLAPQQAARTMTVPAGFQVRVFAAEPDVMQPIGFCIDDRGRLWVAEAYNYPQHGDREGDRIVILEDTDGDGEHDKRTVFFDRLNYVTGIEVGFGGAWVVSPPHFYFIPDRDGDDVPDAEPTVLLDGLGNHANAHNLANGLAWGPDGWLYGTHGRTNWSLIGKPGTPESRRVRFDGGVYRYHPLRHVWEPFADGTTNPWGIDWNDYGDAFVCNCVNPHLFHVIQGAHYEPWRNRKTSQFAYERIPTIADHLHFVGTRNVRDGLGSDKEDDAGGGHAHCGTMIYLGDNWPQKYRNTLFTNNIHGRRVNNDLLRAAGSTYVASHGPDLMRCEDTWFVGVTLAYGPDGSVYVSDWSDKGECHHTRDPQKQTGRIYRIKYGNQPAAPVDMARLDDDALVRRQRNRNDWHVRHARRLLQERHAAGKDLTAAAATLGEWLLDATEPVPLRLRALWALHSIERIGGEQLTALLDDSSPHVRGWAVRLLSESKRPSAAALERFVQLAGRERSPAVRLQLACALQRLPSDDAWPLAEALAQRDESNDETLSLMIWYGIEPLVQQDLGRFLRLGATARTPLLRRHAARRAAAEADVSLVLEELSRAILEQTDETIRRDLLEGMLRGLEGRRSAKMPATWPAAYARLNKSPPDSRDVALRLALVFDDPGALAQLRQRAGDDSAPAASRRSAIDALVARKPPHLAGLLLSLVPDAAVQPAAIRGLAAYDDERTADELLKHFANMPAAVRQDAIQTLASRSGWAGKLLDAVQDGRVPAAEVTAFTARQLRSLGDKDVTEQLNGLWGEVRETPKERARLIADYKNRLTPQELGRSDVTAGAALFKKQCATCHRLFGEGGKIGPDISGAQRTNLDYLLENLLDPSASVAKDYQMEMFRLDSGRVVTGLVESEDQQSVKVFTINERLVIPQAEITARRKSPLSIMPEGMLQQLSFTEIRDLLGFLQDASPGH